MEMVPCGIVGVAERVGVSKVLSKKEDVCLRSIIIMQYRQQWHARAAQEDLPMPICIEFNKD